MNGLAGYAQTFAAERGAVQSDIQARWKRLRLLPTMTHTLARCRTLVERNAREAFQAERINWMKAIQLHAPQTGIEIAELLFEWYLADPEIERAELLRVWRKLLQRVEGAAKVSKGSASLWRQMGIIQASRGQLQDAERHLQKALELSMRLRNRAMTGSSYYELGMIYRNRSDFGRAREAFDRSIENSMAAGDTKAWIYAKGQLANVLSMEGESAGAITLLKECLEAWEQLADPAERNMAHTTLHTLGRIHLENGQYDEAIGALEQSLALKETVKERFDAALRTRAMLAEALCHLGRLDEAASQLSEADAERCGKMGSYMYAASAFKTLSRIHFLEGDFFQAGRMANRALDAAKESNNPHTQFDILLWIYSSNLRRRRWPAMLRQAPFFVAVLLKMRLSPRQFVRLAWKRLSLLFSPPGSVRRREDRRVE